METKNNDMDDLFRQSFENFEQEPPKELKDLIDKQLKFKTKRGFGGLWYFGIVTIILAVSTLIYFNSYKTTVKPELAQNASAKKTDYSSSKNSRNKENHSKKSTPFNSINSISKDSSSNSKTVKAIKINKITDDQNLLNNNNQTENHTTKENTNLKSAKQIHKTSKKTSKVKNTQNYKKRNSKKTNQSFEVQNVSTRDKTKKLELDQTENKTADKINKIDDLDKGILNKNDEALTHKKDSTGNTLSSNVMKDTTQTQDSTHVTSQNNQQTTPKKSIPLLFAFKTDYLLPIGKQNENDFKFSTNNAFHFQLEATYLLKSSLGVNSGINYFSSSQSFSKTITSTDSTFTGFTYQPVYNDSMAYVYDSNNIVIDSFLVTFIIDSISTANFDIKNVNSTQSSNFTISSFSLPLLFYYNQKLGSNLSLDLMTGGILNFQQIKFRDASNPLNSDLTLNKFGIKAILKTSLRYQFNHFGVSLNNTFMYDLKPMQYLNTKARKMSYGVGLGVFWRI